MLQPKRTASFWSRTTRSCAGRCGGSSRRSETSCWSARRKQQKRRYSEFLSPDLALVDLSLPGMSGLQLIKRLQIEQPGLRYLVVTGHVDPLYQRATLSAGARGFVTKDDPDEVLRAIHRVLKEP